MKHTPFLKQVATHLLQHYSNELDTTCLIFPGRRAITYFYKYLSELVTEPVWSPTCLTVTDFYQKYSSLHIANNLLLNAQLYKVYQQIFPKAEDFDHFYAWGNVLLSDFDDIDKYRIDARHIFTHIAETRHIDELFPYLTPDQQELIARFWHHFHLSKDSKEKKQFSTIWDTLCNIYEDFKNNLRQQGIAYEGMLFREVSDLFDSNSIAVPYSRVGFVGLHALTECDRVILNYFKNAGKGLFYWDYNPQFVDDNVHEAGYFIRQNMKDFPSSLPATYFKPGVPDDIEVISVPYQVGQAKWVENILSSCTDLSSNPENLAIVLTNEALLIPLLHAIPPAITDVNITMGYPVRWTNIYTLFQQIVELHLRGKLKSGYYHKQVETILYHPFLLKIVPDWVHTFVRTIQNTNQVYIPVETFSNAQVPLIPEIFGNIDSTEMLITSFLKICNELSVLLFSNEDNEDAEENLIVEKESLLTVRMFLNQLQTVIDSVNISISPQLGMRILMKGLSELKMAFEGEPLRGIQIMGFLETRSLDFDRIIILSANEGFLPRTMIPVSYIPHSLRAAYGLPTLKHRDVMYAYSFYRLLTRCSKVWLMYSTSGDNISEKSRYIRQLEWNSSYKVTFRNMSFSLETIGVGAIEIEKTPDILDKMYGLFTSSQTFLSPSAIAAYLNCPLLFYFRYIADLKPLEDIQEKIDAAVLGSILHDVMYHMYVPYLGKKLDHVNVSPEDIDVLIERSIRSYFDLNENTELPAVAKMIAPIVKKYCELILDFDQKNCSENVLLSLEQSFVTELKLNNYLKVSIGGRMDRIDRTPSGEIRIVDYKTGNVSNTTYHTITDLFSKKHWRKRELLQALIYTWVYYRTKEEKAQPVLYNVQRIAEKKEIIRVALPAQHNITKNDSHESADNQTFLQDVEFELQQLLGEMLDSQLKFSQTEDPKLCKYCSYNQICRR